MNVNNEVTAADIARIAGVGRAAVSNWRRRHPDFPTPTGGPSNSPTFDWAQVQAWLSANGRAEAITAPVQSRGRTPGSDLVRPMAALVPPVTNGVVFDPACADGALLAAVAGRLGARPRYVGHDLDPALADIAIEALADAGATKAEIAVADDLETNTDVVVSVTAGAELQAEGFTYPYGQPNRGDHALGWVQFCLASLKPGGTAVVAVPFSVAVRASGRRIRAELLRAGVLTDVIGLPENAVGNSTAPWQIWVLTPPVGRPAYVLRMVDLTDLSPETLPQDDAAWAAVFADPARTRNVPSIELLDEDVLLVPAAHISVEVRDVTPDYAELRERYAASVGRLSAVAPTLPAGDRKLTAPMVTIGELSRSGSLTVVDRSAARAGDVLVPWSSGNFETAVLDEASAIEIKTGSIIRCDPEAIDPHFLACFLRSETNRRQAAGTSGGTFRLDVRRARVPRLPLSDQRRYGDAFRRLMAFTAGAEEVANAAAAATRTAVYGLTSGVFAPDAL